MTTSPEAIAELLSTARGARPASLACGEAEQALNVALALLVELVVANDRIDRLERLVAELRGQEVGELRDTTYEGQIAMERREANDALLMRALRVFLDRRAAVAG